MARLPLIRTQRTESVVRASGVLGVFREILPMWRESTEKAKELDRWYYSELLEHEMPVMPRRRPAGISDLRDASITGWAKMICDGSSQDLVVDGMRQGDNVPATASMRRWQQNGLDARQKPVHDGVMRHGKAFNLIGRAVGAFDGQPTAFIRGKSATMADAFFRDDFDEYPELFLEGYEQKNVEGDTVWRFDLYDDTHHHRIASDYGGDGAVLIESVEHGMGVCPALRATVNLDLAGRAIGEIEPYIHLFKRLNQDNLDRLVVQRFGAYVIRYIAGITKPGTKEEEAAAALALSITDLLMVENPQGKVGSLPATPLDGYFKASELDTRHLSAVSQTPSFHMLGLSDNVGAEGLAAAEASHMRKMDLAKTSLGEFWETSLRLAGHAAGDRQAAEDFESKAHWKDTSAQSFQSLAQGLAILAEGLEVPPEVLWGRIPNWDDADTREAIRLRDQRHEQERAEAQMDAELESQRQVETQTAVAKAKGAAGGNAGPAAR